VTTVTGDTELALVYIVVEVAGNAGLRRLAEFLPFCMTGAAFDLGMQAEQDIVRK
jgi:hypothetical protein